MGAYTLWIYVSDTSYQTATEYVDNSDVQADSKVNIVIDGVKGIRLNSVFAFDQAEDQIFILRNRKIFKISFPVGQNNPNIENAIAGYEIANKILNSFKFTK